MRQPTPGPEGLSDLNSMTSEGLLYCGNLANRIGPGTVQALTGPSRLAGPRPQCCPSLASRRRGRSLELFKFRRDLVASGRDSESLIRGDGTPSLWPKLKARYEA
jgi:hypothetical protein